MTPARDPGEHLFTFGVLTDSHVNQQEDRSTSPFASNRLSNPRLRWAVRDLERRRPAFVVHLGDMGNPLPELASYRPAAAAFRRIAGELTVPLHLLPGNHCVGDKPTGWVPVPRVCDESLALYEEVYGPQFHSFDHGPCHFAAINSLLINSELAAAAEQQRWLEADLERARAAGPRLWLLMHYPPFVAGPDEPGSYDNLDPPGRGRLLELFERFGVEVALSGHVHNYFYNRHGATDIYTLPTTSFVRQDYAELYTVAPADAEGGRDDRAKLAYGLVDVYRRSHRCRLVRTFGRTAAPGEAEPATASVATRLPQPAGGPLALEVRDCWLATGALRPNNSVSPFTRRAARNDWALAAADELGVRRLRVALQELDGGDVARRMADLTARGMEFVVYSHGLPDAAQLALVSAHRKAIAAWELVLGLDGISGTATALASLWQELPGKLPALLLNPIRDIARGEVSDANVKHEANYGFQLAELATVEGLCRQPAVRHAFSGMVFRLRRRGEGAAPPWEAIGAVAELARGAGLRHHLHVLFSGQLTAERLEDDRATANRVAEAALAAWAHPEVAVTCDTFEDVDRGYFVRHGLVDRRYDPRPAARVLAHLAGALGRLPPAPVARSAVASDGGRLLGLAAERYSLALALPDGRLSVSRLERPAGGRPAAATLIDLDSGTAEPLAVEPGDGFVDLAEPLTVAQPALVVAEIPPPAGR